MIDKYKIKNALKQLVFHRCSKEELEKYLNDLLKDNLKDKIGKLQDHYRNGKEESPEEIYDDSYVFDLELTNKTDIYFEIWFFQTNEPDMIFISEVACDFNEW